MINDLEEVRRLAREKEAENLAFRRYLHDHRRPEREFEEIARQVESAIDCTRCANCCRALEADITSAEGEAIAAHLGMPLEAVLRLYTVFDPHTGARTLAQRAGACVFLDSNLCLIYDARPRPCRDFPHTHPQGVSLGSRWPSVCRNAEHCPILYNALEQYKHRLGFRHG